MNNLNYQQIGDRIRHLRETQGYTQELLAMKAGISSVYLSNIENHVKKPSLETISSLSEILHVSIDFVLFGVQAAVAQNNFEEFTSILSDCNKKERTFLLRLISEAKIIYRETEFLARK